MGAAIAQGFSLLISKLAAIVGWFADLAKAVFVAAWDLMKDAVSWVVEQFLQIATAAVQSINVGAITDHLGVWGSIPGDVLDVLAALGLGTAFSIIATAIVIRLGLQLIPFTRLGS